MTSTKTALAIFVKTPHVSPLKTRLAATIGTPKSLEFYALSLQSVQSILQNSPHLIPYWAVGEKEELNNPLWQSFTAIHSGEGDLGDRQYHIYATLLKKHGSVLLIGADSPQISPEILTQATQALQTQNFVIGPATDGGYYLFGGTKSLPKSFWKSIPWSADNTRSTLLTELQKMQETNHELSPLTDVDTEADLHTIITQMPKQPTQDQSALISWIKNLSPKL